MLHREMLNTIANRTNLDYEDVKKVMEVFKDIFWDEIIKHKEFRIQGVGSFKVKEMPGLGTTNYRIMFKKPGYLYLHKGPKDEVIIVNSAERPTINKNI